MRLSINGRIILQSYVDFDVYTALPSDNLNGDRHQRLKWKGAPKT